ncbi:hypothetical protein BGZ50_009327 [Haplosporangium sp. Z 11]|nr:hypothetical protein BGZ50_009327 [Haplosporangium sp. Z 11]
MDTNNQRKDRDKCKRNDAEAEQSLDISWFEKSHDKTPAAFFDYFGILQCEEGHRRYSRVLRTSSMNKQDRTLLASKFATWKKSEGGVFWEHRNAKAVAMKSAWKTAGNLIEGSEPFAETVIAENAKERRQHSAVPSSTPLASDTQYKRHCQVAEGSSVIDSRIHDDVDPTAALEHYEILNQRLAWIVEKVDLVEQFRAFRLQHLHDFSLARDGIADMRHGSKFKTFLAPQIAATAGKVEPTTTTIHKKWPTLEGIVNRVFAKSHYEDVSKAVRDEDSHDPVVGYILYVVLSYLNYFTFHDEIPNDLNEREGFIDLVWAFIRGAMTLARIETRSLEVLITGVQERKNYNKDPFVESKQVGQYADGVAYRGSSQLYLSEASTIHSPKADKCARDEFKLARAMRDSWISQIRSTCRENVPRRGMAVFGSISYKDETKLWRLDFNGVFRLMQFDAFLVPLKKHEFGVKAKAAVTRCLELALRVQEEIDARLEDAVVVTYEERLKLEDAASAIEITTASPSTSRTKRRWSEKI